MKGNHCYRMLIKIYALYAIGKFVSNAEIQRSSHIKSAVFRLTARNTRLDASVLETVLAHTLLMCSMMCINDLICKSFNFNANANRCEILSGNRLTVGESKLSAANLWEHYEPEDMKSICDRTQGSYPCSEFQKCEEDFTTPKGHICVDLQNIALGKTAANQPYKSSSPSRAVDGNSDTNFPHRSCTQTRCCDPLPWWRVDFGRTAVVYSLKITNRGDCCGGRLSNFNVRVGDSNVGRGEHNALCKQSIAVPQGQTSTFVCLPQIHGRYLYIQTNLQQSLTLCEVEVFGDISK